MRSKVASDSVLAEIASRQHGVVTTAQLRAAGLSSAGIARRVGAGRLHQLHQGVYAVGHAAPSAERRWMAAVLACGGYTAAKQAAVGGKRDGDEVGATQAILDRWCAALSHRDAAALWGLLAPRDGPVDVSVPRDGGRSPRRGIRLHRSTSLSPVDVTLRKGIPITTPARTVRDLRGALVAKARCVRVGPAEVRRAVRQANVLGLPLDPGDSRDRTRSDLERDFLQLCRRRGLPEPEVNVGLGGYLVDFLWRAHRLVVETDGYRYHRGRTAFRDDRRREFDLRVLGYEVIRLSEEQIEREADRVATHLRERLWDRGAPRADL